MVVRQVQHCKQTVNTLRFIYCSEMAQNNSAPNLSVATDTNKCVTVAHCEDRRQEKTVRMD
jgi:hypothetical protein